MTVYPRKFLPVECEAVRILTSRRGSTGYYTPREGTPHYPSFPGTPLFAPFPGASPPYVLFPGTPLHATNEGSDTPGYGPEGYRTPALTNFREWSATPQHDGGSYTPSFGRGYETPVQEFPYDSDQSRNTSVIRRRETEGYGDETPTPFTDDDGDSVMG